MRSTRRFAVGSSLALALASTVLLAGSAIAGGRPISVDLSGAAEAPGPGDPDGSGNVFLTFNPGTGEVCYDFSVTRVAPLTAAHIHVAPAGSPGPVVIPLPPTSATGGDGCVKAARDLIVAILTDPSAYYFNVHNADFPAGALRGQLTRSPRS
jgi:CHRD domain-containing protein